MTHDPRRHYQDTGQAAQAEAATLERRALLISRFRTGSFLVLAAAVLLWETASPDLRSLLVSVALVGAIGFVIFVRRHRRLRRRIERAHLQAELSREGEARLDRDWSTLPGPTLADAPADHPCAGDLDLVGRASLLHLLGRVSTAPGRAVLGRLILDPLSPLPEDASALLIAPEQGAPDPTETPEEAWFDQIAERQDALRILAGETAFRERLELLGREVPGKETPQSTTAFVDWAHAPGFLDDRRGLLAAARFLALFTPLTLAGWLLGWVPGLLPLLGAVAALGIHHRTGSQIHARFSAAEGGEGDLSRWSALLELAESLPEGTPLLDRLRASIQEPAPGAAGALHRLGRITDTAAVRRSSLAHFPLVALCCLDLHILDRMEKWKRTHGHAVDRWIRALGELEAYASLAGLVHDHPDWTFPSFSSDVEGGIRARDLGHPLLHPDRCVTNDVDLPAPGTLLVVTGSNMAGKTTLLRALGANQVLALAGAPVTAREFHTRPILPWTTMRVRDSLEEGVSYFLAELQRLRRVVEAARRGPVLYLLDEILQGTNSAERRTAARTVLSQLLDTRAIGGITTHDLTLADAESLRSRSVHVHFREEVVEEDGRRALTFDYRLRPGPATSRNALLLLEMVGLGGTDHPTDAGG